MGRMEEIERRDWPEFGSFPQVPLNMMPLRIEHFCAGVLQCMVCVCVCVL